MTYTVIHRFMDLQDNKHIYRVGDKYPRPGYVASEERIQRLLSTNNKAGKVFIEEDAVKEAPKKVEKKAKKKYSKTEVMRMPVKQLRKVAAEMGLENPDELIGSELKEWIVEHL